MQEHLLSYSPCWLHDFMAADILNPGISNADAKLSTLNLSSTISLLFCSPLINSRCSFAVPFCTTRVICTALWRNDAIVSKSVSMQPRDVIAGVPGGANQEKSFRSPPTTYLTSDKRPTFANTQLLPNLLFPRTSINIEYSSARLK